MLRKLCSIERRIREIDGVLSDRGREKDMARGIPMPIFEKKLEAANRPYIDERAKLVTERQFILDRRDNLFWRTIWSFIVPVIVTITTTYILQNF